MQTNNELKTPFVERLSLLIGDEGPYAWANRVGIPRSAFWRIWTDSAIPRKKTLLRIQEATGASPDWLLHGLGEPPPDVQQRLEQQQAKPVAPVIYPTKEGGLNSDRNLEYRAVQRPLDMERLALALETVEEGLCVTRRTMAPDKKAELVAAVYDLFEERTPAMKERVLRLVKSAA